MFPFASRARGDNDEASDWDLFVVLPDDAPPGIARPSALRRAAVSARLPIHAVACRRGVFEAKREYVHLHEACRKCVAARNTVRLIQMVGVGSPRFPSNRFLSNRWGPPQSRWLTRGTLQETAPFRGRSSYFRTGGGRIKVLIILESMVGATGIEPVTPAV